MLISQIGTSTINRVKRELNTHRPLKKTRITILV